jgi:hypothetical protein
MDGTSALSWRKSSRSGNNGGDCVEVADTARVILVRDTKDRDGAVIAFSAGSWQKFAATIKNDSVA